MVYSVTAEVNSDELRRVACPPPLAAANDDEMFGPPIPDGVGTVPEFGNPLLDALAERFGAEAVAEGVERAGVSGACALREMLLAGRVAERELYEAIAAWLDRPFGEVTGEGARAADGKLPRSGSRRIEVMHEDGTRAYVAPDLAEAIRLRMKVEVHGAADIVVTTPSGLEAAIEDCRREEALRDAVHGLYEAEPNASARFTTTGWQGFLVSTTIWFVATAAITAPIALLLGLHVVLSIAFASCVALRFLAARQAARTTYAPIPKFEAEDLPTYSVLVALHREAAVVPQIIDHLSRLRWPRAKLDIRLVCEEDDAETLAAIEAHGLPSHMRVVRTPFGGPRTKPKALNYAMDGATGEFIVLYDAEDRPHPFQLIEAYAAFIREGEELDCVQAPLQIDNGHRSFFSRGFAVEYAALFRGLLPWLARRALPIPLGGTSNHFRRDAIVGVGAWDPYNVTEDADLGFRLARGGYRTDVLTRPTIEAAPETFGVWVRQRTRWLKGWMQTWLVHMREPRQLWRDLGPRGFAVFQLVTLGMVASAVFHPLMLATVAVTVSALLTGIVPGALGTGLLALDVVNVLLGYGAFLVLARAVLHKRERWVMRGSWWRLPVYWMALGLASYRALWQLWRCPHHWEKTPHQPSGPRG